MSNPNDLGLLYLEIARGKFVRTKALAERAIEQLENDELVKAPAPGSNSVAITMKHIAGNQLSRWTDFLTTDGEKPWRHRDQEFEDAGWSRVEIMAHWEKGWSTLFEAIDALTPDDLEKHITIRSEPQTVMWAIERQISHYAYHVGQIVYVARMLKGADWQTLSIARGASSAYNDAMGHDTSEASQET